MDDKQRVGLEAAKQIENGMVVGLGTGSTATHFIRELARRIREETLSIQCVSSSLACSLLARAEGVSLLPTDQADRIDLYVDGADEVSPEKSLIKGRGAAMVGEKLLAEACARFLVIVDEGKLVQRLGTKFPVPVEIMPASVGLVRPGIAALGGKPALRLAAGGKDGPVVTDNGNLILDVTFPPDPDWNALDVALNSLPGVVGHGLFLRYAKKSTILVGHPGGVRILA
ncbi:MAG TPA: ribose-5-phosphate isomerase RpiA [Fibrobacteria bacterium]|nr:ribose-5-phosphate isomerase RpiA [Fibrobacteria bacterium]